MMGKFVYYSHTLATAVQTNNTTVEHIMRQLQRPTPVLIPGGADIDPTLYGQAITHARVCSPTEDRLEFEVARYCLENSIPVLGICRGHQIICAAAGGTLYQDLHEDGVTDNHRHSTVTLSPDSILAGIMGDSVVENVLRANSLHHQAVQTVPPGWKAVAWAPDGVIEAIEHPELPVVSVQWHPEMTQDQLDLMLNYLEEKW